MKKFIYTLLFCGTAMISPSCLSDLDQYPHEETTSENVFSNPDNYRSALAKIYVSMVINGQEKGGGNADLSSNIGQDYMRSYFNLQELGTDEVASTWLTGDKVSGLTYLNWDANDAWVADMYYRIYYNISLCNEFLRNSSDGKISGFTPEVQKEIKGYRAEARFMRALFYYHALDLFRNIPFVTENDPVGGFIPPRNTPQQTFEYIESELKTITNGQNTDEILPARAQSHYGRASKGAAYALLAKLYLNAKVYIGTDKYTECISAAKSAIDEGYTLEPDYASLFNADNDKRTHEIIFSLPVDATHTVSWGASTYLVCGAVSLSSETQKPEDYGVKSGWGSMRARGELTKLFKPGDNRAMFYTQGQSQDVNAMDSQADGYLVTKWTNITDDGKIASNTVDGGVNTDFPLIRLADVYLMYAEAVLRGGQGGTRAQALSYINALRQRAYGSNTAGQISDSELTLQFILNERGRELYWEGTRRTDLIRYDMFTTDKYLWQWKGEVKEGKAVDSRYNIYPIPSTELTANPNLHNENY